MIRILILIVGILLCLYGTAFLTLSASAEHFDNFIPNMERQAELWACFWIGLVLSVWAWIMLILFPMGKKEHQEIPSMRRR